MAVLTATIKTDQNLKYQLSSNEVLLYKIRSLTKLLRITGYLMRFIKNAKEKKRIQTEYKGEYRRETVVPTDPITVEEYENSLHFWIRYEQKLHFKEEYKALLEEDDLPRKSQIASLQPYICGETGLMKIEGRLQESSLSENHKHQVILPKDGEITRKIVMREHLRNGCFGSNFLHNLLRHTWWILHGKCTIKRIIKSCIVCKIIRPKLSAEKMPPLPIERVTVAPCFTFVGMDIAGPLYTKEKVGERVEIKKVYYLLFSCFTSRMTHL